MLRNNKFGSDKVPYTHVPILGEEWCDVGVKCREGQNTEGSCSDSFAAAKYLIKRYVKIPIK